MENPPASSDEIAAAEQHLGVRFPDDYRAFLARENGRAAWYGKVYLVLDSVADVVGSNDASREHRAETFPGLVFIGSDGAGEGIGFDLRRCPPPIVLVNYVSAGWHEALFQASSFSEFMAQRERHEEFVWTEGYS